MQANQAKASGKNIGFTNNRVLWAIAYKASTLNVVPTIVCGRENSQKALTQLCGAESFLSTRDLLIKSLPISPTSAPKKLFCRVYNAHPTHQLKAQKVSAQCLFFHSTNQPKTNQSALISAAHQSESKSRLNSRPTASQQTPNGTRSKSRIDHHIPKRSNSF